VIGDAKVLSLAEAREQARKVLADIQKGQDPQQTKTEYREAETFGELAAQFIEHSNRTNRSRTSAEDKRLLTVEVLPTWRHIKVSDIRRRDAIHLLEKILARDVPVLTNRVQQVLSRTFEFAVNREIVEVNPIYRLKKLAKEKSRTRVLKRAELTAFFKTVDARKERTIPNIYKLAFLTVTRANEVCGIRWNEIEGGIWTIPAERMKNKREHTLPLSKQALAVLKDQREVNQSRKRSGNALPADYGDFVFPSSVGGPIREYKKVLQKLLPVLRVEGADSPVERFSMHDLRRTGATVLQQAGFEHEVIESVLSHTLKGVAATYQRGRRLLQMAQALDHLGEYFDSLFRVEASNFSNVISLHDYNGLTYASSGN